MILIQLNLIHTIYGCNTKYENWLNTYLSNNGSICFEESLIKTKQVSF